MRKMPYSPVKFSTRVHRIVRLYTSPISVSTGDEPHAVNTVSTVRPQIDILDLMAEPSAAPLPPAPTPVPPADRSSRPRARRLARHVRPPAAAPPPNSSADPDTHSRGHAFMANQLDQNLQPTVSVFGNLRRMRDGSIWADYRLTGLPYGYTSDQRKYDTLVHHKNLFRALPNNAVIAGLIAAMNPDEILARAIAGTDVNAMPMWREECEGKHEFFSSTVRPTERIFTVSFPVVDSDVVTDLTGWARRAAIQGTRPRRDDQGRRLGGGHGLPAAVGVPVRAADYIADGVAVEPRAVARRCTRGVPDLGALQRVLAGRCVRDGRVRRR